jgi:hypothetical protein
MTAIMIEAALRALVFAIAVGAGLRLLRVSNVPVRKAAWSLVLIASVAMPFLMRVPVFAGWSGRMGWALPMRLNRLFAPRTHALPTAAAEKSVMVLRAEVQQDSEAAETVVAQSPNTISAAPDDATVLTMPASIVPSAKFHWPPAGRLIAMVYLAVGGALLLRLLWGAGAALSLWKRADLVSPLIAPEPNVRSSAKILSPVTIGSGIVLPANYLEWDMKKLRTVLAHERSHVRQLDFYLQMLAGLYTAMFWFSPLGWWLRRTLASLGEAIGDRAGIDAAASRSGYAEILLEFAAMPRQNLPGVAMARSGNLSHRIERLLNEHLFRSAFAVGRRRALVSLLLIPVALFAVTVLIRVPGASAQTAPTPATAPTPPTAPAPAVAPAPAATPDGEPAPAVAPEPPPAPGDQSAPPPTPAAPAPPPARGWGSSSSTSNSSWSNSGSSSSHGKTERFYTQRVGNSYAYGYSGGGESYAILEGPGNDVTFSGNWDGDVKVELEAMGKIAKGPFLWFTHEGTSYVVTDPAIIAKIRTMYKPMEDLQQQQEALEKKQEPLEKQQEELERQQEAAASVRMPDMSKELAEVDAAIAKEKQDRDQWDTKHLAEVEKSLKAAQDQTLSPEKFAELQEKLAAAQEQFSSEQSEIQTRLGELQGRLGELQGEAGARQGDFGAKMGELGAQEGRLGAEEGKLGAEEGRLARQADQQVRSIIEESLRNGKATPVPDVK